MRQQIFLFFALMSLAVAFLRDCTAQTGEEKIISVLFAILSAVWMVAAEIAAKSTQEIEG